MDAAFLGLIVIVLVALAFDYTNGFHDAANAIAVAVSTKALTPRVALALAAVMNLVGALISTKVAKTVGDGIIDPPEGSGGPGDRLRRADRRDHLEPDHLVLRAAVVVVARPHRRPGRGRARRLPLGAVDGHPRQGRHPDGPLAAGRLRPRLPVHAGDPVDLPAPPTRTKANRGFRYAQIVSSATMALGHGMQDAQKTMGIITLALFTAGEIDTFEVPFWVILASAAAISAGTYAGGFRIMRTLGRRIIQLTPAGGFAAQTVASGVMITTATVFAVPVSTTHITTTSIMGVGATRRLSAVRWGVAGNIVVAWIVTLPAAGAVAALAYFLTHARRRLGRPAVTGASHRSRSRSAPRGAAGSSPSPCWRRAWRSSTPPPSRWRCPSIGRELGRVAVGPAVDGHRLHADAGRR